MRADEWGVATVVTSLDRSKRGLIAGIRKRVAANARAAGQVEYTKRCSKQRERERASAVQRMSPFRFDMQSKQSKRDGSISSSEELHKLLVSMLAVRSCREIDPLHDFF